MTGRKKMPVISAVVLLLAFAVLTLGRGGFDGSEYSASAVEGDHRQAESQVTETASTKEYRFRSRNLLNQHYEKHGEEMGFKSAEEYQKAASAVVTNPSSLHKTEKEDGDDVYYLEATNEFVIVSTDGYLRTYFKPDSGIKYYNKQ
ncbi:MAG: hypothetical protein K5857_08615 [Lachnospiraceae bacterium]|nr:hypothetical protein [Lachnospiraceae bacterium]